MTSPDATHCRQQSDCALISRAALSLRPGLAPAEVLATVSGSTGSFGEGRAPPEVVATLSGSTGSLGRAGLHQR